MIERNKKPRDGGNRLRGEYESTPADHNAIQPEKLSTVARLKSELRRRGVVIHTGAELLASESEEVTDA